MLEISRIDAFYGDAHVLHDLSMTVGRGERVAVLGRNGAGKSTLLKSVMNAGPKVRGDVSWNSRPMRNEPPFRRTRAGMSLVPEDRRIFPHLTVAENLELIRGAATGECYRVDEILDWFPILKDLLARMGNELSGGQQQALAVARGVIAKPDLLLLDEPTEGLAPIIVDQLADSINKVMARGASLLLCEQNIHFARNCVDRVLVLDSGIVVFAGTWSEFDRDPSVKLRHLAL